MPFPVMEKNVFQLSERIRLPTIQEFQLHFDDWSSNERKHP